VRRDESQEFTLAEGVRADELRISAMLHDLTESADVIVVPM